MVLGFFLFSKRTQIFNAHVKGSMRRDTLIVTLDACFEWCDAAFNLCFKFNESATWLNVLYELVLADPESGGTCPETCLGGRCFFGEGAQGKAVLPAPGKVEGPCAEWSDVIHSLTG